MINEMILKDFKCFRNVTMGFGNMTILAGANASGKSSVIQAILLYFGSRAFGNLPIDLNKTLGIEVGSAKNLVSQYSNNEDEVAFSISINGINYNYQYDRMTLLDLTTDIHDINDDTEVWYLNAERLGPRLQHIAGGQIKVNYNGDNAVYILDYVDSIGSDLPDELKIDRNITRFSRQVELWMSFILGEMQFSTNVNKDSARVEIRIRNNNVGDEVVSTMTGFGISYALPIVVSGLIMAAKNIKYKNSKVLIIENPEAHLHPSAQTNIGKFLSILAMNGVQVVVETHSEHVIDGARIEFLRNNRTNDMILNFFKAGDNKYEIKRLSLALNGEIEQWPDGFFDQKRKDLKELFELRRKNGNC